MGVKEGGIMRTAFQGGGRDMGRQSSGREMGGDRNRGSTNTGNVGGASNRGNGDNRREQYSVAQTQNIAPTTIAS